VFQGTREDMRKELPYQIMSCQSLSRSALFSRESRMESAGESS
jgi:hypothetical protein